MTRERLFADRSTLAQTLAASVAGSLRESLNLRPTASLVVSGGSTPRPFFECLRTQSLPWDRVHITLADERWVDARDAASNERMVREHLLRDQAHRAHFVPLKTTARSPAEGLAECAGRIAPLQPFAVVVLGMGGDGHTASLFPHSEALAEGLSPVTKQICLAVPRRAGEAARITLTLAVLLGTERLILHMNGAEKWRIYQQALTGAAAEELPIQAVFQQATQEVEVYWSP